MNDNGTAQPLAEINETPSWEVNALLYGPIFLLVLMSYFKSDILGSAALNINSSFWWGYWAIRAALICLFITLVLSTNIGARAHALKIDRFEAIRREKDPLLGLRAMACMLVFFGHWLFVVFAPAAPSLSSSEYVLRALLSASPWGGVWIFFCLSGYLMGKGFVTQRHKPDRGGIIRFYKNRIFRIAPIFVISMLIVALLERPDFLDITKKDALINFLDVALLDLKGNGVIGALWSICTELQFYLLVPVLYLSIRKISKNALALTALAICIVFVTAVAKYKILESFPTRWHDNVYFPFLGNIDCFLVGMIVAFLVQSARDSDFYIKCGLQFGLIAMSALYLFISLWSYPEMVSFPNTSGSPSRIFFLSFAPGITALLTGGVIYCLECATRFQSRKITLWTIQTYLGAVTYCLYVWHEPVITSIRPLFRTEMTFGKSILILPVGFALTLTMASLFYFHVEQYYDSKRT